MEITSKTRRQRFLGTLVACAVLLALGRIAAQGAEGADVDRARPWWKQEKIRFFWGEWNYLDRVGVSAEEMVRNVSRVGATVVAEGLHRYTRSTRGGRVELTSWRSPEHVNPDHVKDDGVWYDLAMARAAQKYGVRYLAGVYVMRLLESPSPEKKKAPRSMDKEGKPYFPHYPGSPCPLYKPFYEDWFLKPALRAAKTGVVDGLHLDWEFYAKNGEAGVCYCDTCFKTFLELQGLAGIHEAHPTFVFSGYNLSTFPFRAIARGLSTDEVPFLMVDSRHYQEDHTRPWWDTYDAGFRKQGFLRIGGTWDNACFGGQPYYNVSATQWMYDTAMHADGVWVWFEQEVTPDLWRAFWVGDRRIRATEAKVGKYLLAGGRDIHFVTLVERTGSPELARKVKQITYHLGDEHLAHVNNVDTDRPVQVRLRFPRLGAQTRWTVRDPISDLYYSADGETPVWEASELFKGLSVSLEKRSELFFLLLPAGSGPQVDASRLVVSQEIRSVLEHVETKAAPAKSIAPAGKERLAYLATQTLDYLGPQVWAIGNAVFSVKGTQSKVVDLPIEWKFKLDPKGVGLEENWPKLTRFDDWDTIRVDDFWTKQGYDYHGVAWYAVEFEYPEGGPTEDLTLEFGAVDGYADIYIDGDKVAEQKVSPSQMWNKPFSRKIEAPLRPGKHVMVVRVEKEKYAAGIWKPVWIDASDNKPLYGHKGYLWEPTWSPDGRRIAFTCYVNGRGQIYLMYADGSGVANISSNEYCDRSSAWSPDGRKITFVSGRDGDWEIYVMNADGSSQKRLTESAGMDERASWSPDGKQLAFESERGGDTDIFVMATDGSNQRSVTNLPGHELDPAWSPDGKRIAFSATAPTMRHLMVVDADGTDRHEVIRYLNDVGSISWSPDGERIAAAFRGPQERDTAGVLTVRPDGEDRKDLVIVGAIRPHPGGGRHPRPSWYSTGSASPRWVMRTFGGVSWSADSKRVAFSSDMDDGCFYVYTVSPDGGEPKRFDNTRSAWLQETSWCPK